LVRANYGGSKRASAYGVLFGVAAAGAAFGPLIGGWLTSNATWRYAFAGEAVIVVIVLATSGMLKDAPNVIPVPKLDLVGAGLSIVGLGLLVFGVLQTTTYGWSNPLVLSLVVAGLAVLGLFVWWVRYREAERRPTLVRLSLFRHRTISAGLPTLATQLFAQAGLLFLIPVFTQTVLGFDAFETGLTLLPLSIGVLVTSVTTPRLGRVIYPKYIIQAGLVVMFIGGFVLARSLNGAESGGDLALGLLLGGTGIGLTVGQLPNLILSGVEQDEASEASGLQGAFQNLGMAMGTAVVGSVILSVAIATFGTQVERSSVFPEDFKTEVVELMRQPIEQADGTRLTGLIADLPPDQHEEAIRLVDEGTLRGFQAAIVAGGIVALIGALIAIRLPKSKLESDHSADSIVAEIVRNPAIPKLQFEMEDLE
jgi:MFS family permease